ncbi:hypothetical protein AZA_70083 [Nitrospirillum viridazoti Y2]|uniref:Uncharacterized protein n=1 Tax=Nitrospirillum amazonense TaxID=28077 RepID=A0A560HYC5_9PROT|nr:hypothetical protein [Nitrospirillum amazonense]EGY00418.1 hypothetical protein AZA_70083 [Nitrospirillum amazonense Y2]TWB50941.1 hypothetical protein FBZ92_12233 [Nitrospirillum amazonense]
MNDAASALVIDLAREFTAFLNSHSPGWVNGYYRFRAEKGRQGANASYTTASDVQLIGAVKAGAFYAAMNEMGAALLRTPGKGTGVFLLTVNAGAQYDIQFDWDDLDRWWITKLDGGKGLPAGA